MKGLTRFLNQSVAGAGRLAGSLQAGRVATLKLFLFALTAALASAGELEVADFTFAGPLGSDGARIEKVAKNQFRIRLAPAPNHPEWPNKLNFQIRRKKL